MATEEPAKTVSGRTSQSPLARVASAAKETLAGFVTLLALFGFSAFIVYLLFDIGAKDPVWSRRTYLFAAVEAVTFAAVGWLFGKEVHRERAEAAEKRADSSETKADTASAKAAAKSEESARLHERGLALKQAIEGARESHRRLAPHLQRSFGAAADSVGATTGSQLDSLAIQAEKLFPD